MTKKQTTEKTLVQKYQMWNSEVNISNLQEVRSSLDFTTASVINP